MIVPALTMPPAKVESANDEMLAAVPPRKMPSLSADVIEIVPELVIPPEKVEIVTELKLLAKPPTSMPAPRATIVPELLIPPPKVEIVIALSDWQYRQRRCHLRR